MYPKTSTREEFTAKKCKSYKNSPLYLPNIFTAENTAEKDSRIASYELRAVKREFIAKTCNPYRFYWTVRIAKLVEEKIVFY